MYAIKGGWVGQTFALAKHNDSGGKKARIRISKDERKKMVETFINNHQSLNNGSFPSLNLTHKEVGGSFYTVREIVREIIQENRVLGPAKLMPDEQINNWVSKEYPLGSISTEPHTSFSVSPSGSAYLSGLHLDTAETLVRGSDESSRGLENEEFGHWQIINGNHVLAKDNGSDRLIHAELQISKQMELDIPVVASCSGNETMEKEKTGKMMSAVDGSKTLELEETVEDYSPSVNGATLEMDKTLQELSSSDAIETLQIEKTVKEISKSDISENVETETIVEELLASDRCDTSNMIKITELSSAGATETREGDTIEEFSLHNETMEMEKTVEMISAVDASRAQELEQTVEDYSASVTGGGTLEMDKTVQELASSDAIETLEIEKSVKEISKSDTSETVETERTIEEHLASDRCEASKMIKNAELSSAGATETMENETIEDFSAHEARVTYVAETDVVVETFPLRPSKSTDSVGGNISELTKPVEEKEAEKVYGHGKDSILLDGLNSFESSVKKRNAIPWLGDEKVDENLKDVLLENSYGLESKKGKMHNAVLKSLVAAQTSTNNATNAIHVSSRTKDVIQQEEIATIESKTDVQFTNIPKNQNNRPLDRAKLTQSWEKTSATSAEEETNPLLVFFKSFIDAFVKFWTE